MIAGGAVQTADFSTLDLATSPTVSLNGPRTIGRIVFGDATPSHDWTLATGSGGPLTLQADAEISVLNRSTNITSVITGVAGLRKTGNGTLILSAINTYSGNTWVDEGTLRLAANSGGTGTLRGTLNIQSGGAVIASTVNALGWSGNNWVRTINIERGIFTTTAAGDQGWGLTVNLSGGTLLASGAGSRITAGGNTNFNSTHSDLTSVIGGEILLREGNSNNLARFRTDPGVAHPDLDFTGFILSTTAGRGISKNGTGSMRMSGVSSLAGPVSVTAGTMIITGSLTTTQLSVIDSTLAGSGTVTGPVNVSGTLSPGDDSIATLQINGPLVLGPSAVTRMEVFKSGTNLSNDRIQNITNLTHGGLLVVSVAGDPLVPGDSFILFSAAARSGSFSTIDLPPLGGGLGWDSTLLTSQGRLTVTKAIQTIAFPPLAEVKLGDPAFPLNASASSGLEVSYRSSNPEVATVSGNVVTLAGSGYTTITASQAGDASYSPAAEVSRVLTVNRAVRDPQTISFAPLDPVTLTTAPFALQAAASSGLPISFTSSDHGIATVTGNTLAVTGAGIVTLTARQAGNTDFEPATEVQRQLLVTGTPQSITFAPLSPQTLGNRPIVLAATAGSGLPVGYTSSNPEVATVNGSVLTLVAPGTSVITATQAGNSLYDPATPVSRELVVVATGTALTVTPAPLSLTLHSGETVAFPIRFHNPGQATIDWTLQLPAASPVPLSASPLQYGTTPDGSTTVNLTVNATGIAPGSYPTQLTATYAGVAQPVAIPCVIEVAAPLLALGQSSVFHTSVSNGSVRNFPVSILSTDGSPRDWTAEIPVAASWLSLANPSGSTPGELGVVITPSVLLNFGTYRSTVRVRTGRAVYDLPVTLEFARTSPREIIADPIRPRAYALNPGLTVGQVLVLDDTTAQVQQVIPVGFEPLAADFSRDGRHLFVHCYGGGTIEKIDLQTLEVVASHRFAEPTTFVGQFQAGIAAGPDDIIYYTSRNQALNVLDFKTGTELASITGRRLAALTMDVSGQRLFALAWNTPSLAYEYDISSTLPTFLRQFSGSSPGSTSTASMLFKSWAGGIGFAHFHRYDFAAGTSEPIIPSTQFSPVRVTSLSIGGNLLSATDGLYSPSGQKLMTLSPTYHTAAINHRTDRLIGYNASSGLAVVEIPVELRPPSGQIVTKPAAGGSIPLGTASLEWTPPPFSSRFRVFLGTNEAGINAAQPGSPLELGTTTSPVIALPPGLAPGANYWWRIDFLRGEEWITGTARQFGIIDANVTPGRLDLRLPSGIVAQQRTLRVADSNNTPLAWTATSSQSWLTAPASGTGDLALTINASALAVGTHQTTIRIGAAGGTIEVPVVVDVFALNLLKLEADPRTPGEIHGLHGASPGRDDAALIVFRATDGAPLRSVDLRGRATDFDVHGREDRIYFTEETARIEVLDRITLGHLPDLTLPFEARLIEGGPAGKLVVEPLLQPDWMIFDSTTGELLWQSADDVANDDSGGITDASGNLYWRTDQNGSGTLSCYDLSQVPPRLLASTADALNTLQPLCSADGTRAFALDGAFDASAKRLSSLEEPVLATDSRGDIAAGNQALVWSISGQEITRFADATTLAVVSADDRYLLRYNLTSKRLVVTALAPLVSLPGPMPQPGSYLRTPPDRLVAPPVDGAVSYRFFLGISESEVRNAAAGSTLDLGTSTQATLVLNPLPQAGRRYFWRVDTQLGSSTRTGPVWSFDLPFPDGPELPVSVGLPKTLAFGESVIASGRIGGFAILGFDEVEGRFSEQTASVRESGFDYPAALAFANPSSVSSTDLTDTFDSVPDYFYTHRRQPNGRWRIGDKIPVPISDLPLEFGTSIAGDGNWLLVGQPGYAFTDPAPRGEVKVYHEQQKIEQIATLRASDGFEGDLFGHRVALSGNLAIVSSPGDGFGATVPRVYFFERNPTTGAWTQRGRVVQTGAVTGSFGASVAIEGDLAVIGSPSDAFVEGSIGRAFLYTRQANGSWSLTNTLNSQSIAGASGDFGSAVAISGDLVLVGAPSSLATSNRIGQVFPFRRSASTWQALPPLRTPSERTAAFGSILAARDGWLVAGDNSNNGEAYFHGPWMFRLASQPAGGPRLATPALDAIGAGKTLDFPITASSPAGGITFALLAKPSWMTLENTGPGTARLTGTITSSAGTVVETQVRIRDANGRVIHRTWRSPVLGPSDAPAVASIPPGGSFPVGQDHALRPVVTGAEPLSYRWERNGVPVNDQTGPVLFLEEMSPGDAGDYVLRVSNAAGSAASGPIRVNVPPPDRMAGDWTTMGSSTRRAGFHPAALGRHRFAPAWQRVVHPGALVQRAAIAGGKVFVVPQIGNTGNVDIQAFSLSTGAPQWSHPVAAGRSMNPPSWHDGKLYFQRGAGTGSSAQLICLDADDGTRLWASDFEMQNERYEAPAVDSSGIYINGGRFGGLYGFNTDGSRRFFQQLPQIDNWAPARYRDQLFTWVGLGFSEHSIIDGSPFSTINVAGSPTYGTLPAFGGNRAFMIGSAGIHCVDLATFELAWRVQQTGFSGSPAVHDGSVFAIHFPNVRSFSLADGSEGTTFRTDSTTTLIGQPLLFHDHLAVASESRIWIFSRQDGTLVQTLDGGGRLSYSAGYLIAGGNDGTVRAYFANRAPEFSAATPASIASGDSAADRVLNLGTFAIDEDPQDPSTWSILSVSNPGIFRSLEIDPSTGDLSVIYNPWTSGSSEVVVSVTDSAGNSARQTITFSVPALPEPNLQVAATLTLNRQTGLYEHRITVSNAAAREVAGFDLALTGLPAGVTVNNASSRNGDNWAIHHRQPLAAGASVTLLVEYFAPARGTVIDPEVAVSLVLEPETDPAAAEAGLAVDRCEVMADKSLLIEFTSVPGALYEIQYSDNTTDWKTSPVKVRAAGNRVQWIDRGPPRTDTPPSTKSSRFYRVREISAP